jgi:hypothetical protein
VFSWFELLTTRSHGNFYRCRENLHLNLRTSYDYRSVAPASEYASSIQRTNHVQSNYRTELGPLVFFGLDSPSNR